MFSKEKGIFDSDAEWFFAKCEGNGWTNHGEKIKNWKMTLVSWFKAGYLPSQKQQKRDNPGRPSRQSEAERWYEKTYGTSDSK